MRRAILGSAAVAVERPNARTATRTQTPCSGSGFPIEESAVPRWWRARRVRCPSSSEHARAPAPGLSRAGLRMIEERGEPALTAPDGAARERPRRSRSRRPRRPAPRQDEVAAGAHRDSQRRAGSGISACAE
jgi:hypothetical protein